MNKTSEAKQEWKQRIKQWLESGKSCRAWCLEHQVSYQSFMNWKKRLKNSELDAQFVELKSQNQNSIILEYDNVKIHLTTNFDTELLKHCLNVLRGN